MNSTIVFAQLLNGLQYGVLLFLLAAGRTLVFRIMSFVNLAHGSLYMMGAYFAATAFQYTGSFRLAVLAAVLRSPLPGRALECVAVAPLYRRGHHDHVPAAGGLVLFLS